MCQTGIQADTLSLGAAIRACGTGSLWDKALCLFEDMQLGKFKLGSFTAPAADLYSFKAAMVACGEAGWQHCISLFERMLQKEIEPDVQISNKLLTALGGGRQWQSALNLIHLMTSRGLEPDAESFRIVIDATMAGKDWNFDDFWVISSPEKDAKPQKLFLRLLSLGWLSNGS